MPKFFVTKYALTSGIKEVEAPDPDPGEDMIVVKAGFEHYHGADWHLNREAALIQAERMRKKRITSLQKQIAKLEKMTFA